MEKGEVLVHEHVRNKVVLLSSVGWKHLSVTYTFPPFFSELASQSTKIDGSAPRYEGYLLLCVIRICQIDIHDRTKSLAGRNLGRALPRFKARDKLERYCRTFGCCTLAGYAGHGRREELGLGLIQES